MHVAKVVLICLCWIGSLGCTTRESGPTSKSAQLTVFAAASLIDAFNEIGTEFTMNYPNSSVIFSFGSSSQLAEQIVQGAPVDLFASANQKQMDNAASSGRIDEGSVTVFAQNRLVVIFPQDNPAGILQLSDLSKPGINLILAAPEVPAGQYALEFLQKANVQFGAEFEGRVLANVVSYEENVRAVLTKVALGEADAGIVYTTDTHNSSAQPVGQLSIPDELNVIATYPIASLNDSQRPEMVQALIAFTLSPDGQAILQKFGFIPITNK